MAEISSDGDRRVLVMDDEEMLREVAVSMLEEMGFQVLQAEEGGQAVKQYQQAMEQGAPLDLVLMDMTVPVGMDGIEAAQKILDMDANARIIICTGHAVDGVLSRYSGIPFSGAISKPYNYEGFSRAINAALAD